MKKLRTVIILSLLVVTFFFSSCEELDTLVSEPDIPVTTSGLETTEPQTSELETVTEMNPVVSDGSLVVTFLDVGQADCIILEYDDSAMIIDSGNNADADFVVQEIQNMGIDHFDVVVGTHPHEDHIGGLDAVIETFAIDTIYMPKLAYTTKTYEDVLTAILDKGLNITTPVPGSTFTLGDDVICRIIAPNGNKYDDTNSYSIVLDVTFNDTSFIFTGDAEADSEQEILDAGYDISADVLKVGHHGSTSSTSDAFLNAISPTYAVIPVGEDNTYGHPHAETLDILNNAGVEVYRTDESGTITFTVTRNEITVTTEK